MRCFTVYYDQLNGVLSPLFFISQPQDTKGFIPLNKIAFVNPTRPSPRIKLDEKVPYVGLPETDDGKIKEVLYRPYKEVKGRNHFVKNDILFARIEPSVFNQKYIYADDLKNNDYAFTSTEFYIVKAKEETDTKYIFYMLFTDQVFEQIKGKTTGSTGRRRLDKSAFENTLVPYPSKEVRAKVVEILETAYKQREENLKQADELLGSIDDFVRQQLGIVYKEPEEEKIYTVNSQDIENNRQDPYYFKPNFISLERILLENKAVKLGELIKSITNGLDYRKFSEDGTLDYLRVSNIKPHNIDYTEVKKVKLIRSDITKSIFGVKDDVLLTRKGTYGISVSLEEDLNAIISSEIFLLKVYTEKVNPQYLSIFLNSSLGQKQFLRNKVGAIMGSLSQESVKDTLIVLPSEGMQASIVNQVKSQIRKSKELKQEAELIITKAKKQVEVMILN